MLSTADGGIAATRAVRVYDRFVSQLDELEALAPETALHVTCASDLWVRVFTETVAVNGVVMSVVFSIIVAFASLILFTGNVIVSLLAVLSIVCNIFMTLALYDVWGWELGVVEAISISILVGLSVDCKFLIMLNIELMGYS